MFVFSSSPGNADDWVEMEIFGREHELFSGTIWDFQMGYLPMIRFRVFFNGAVGIP